MTAPYERGVELSRRFKDWWNDIPDPFYDQSVRHPRDELLPILVLAMGIIMVLVVVGQALQKAGVSP